MKFQNGRSNYAPPNEFRLEKSHQLRYLEPLPVPNIRYDFANANDFNAEFQKSYQMSNFAEI